MHRCARMHTRRMPRFERLRNKSADKPVADRLTQHRVAFSRGLRRKHEVWEWSDFLVADNLDAQLRLKVVRIIARGVKIRRDPRAHVGGHQARQPGLDVSEGI